MTFEQPGERFDAWCRWLAANDMAVQLFRHGTFYQDIKTLFESRGVATLSFEESECDLPRIADAAGGSRPGRFLFLTVNFWPPLALLTEKLNIPYAAWVVDCTLNVNVHMPQFARPNAHVFVFDERDLLRFTQGGFPNVHFMPQSSNDERMRKMDLTPQEREDFGSDVSFVGDALIRDCNEYRNLFLPLLEKRTAQEPDPIARRNLRLTRLSCEETLDAFDANCFMLIDEITSRLKEKESEYRAELAKLGVADFEHLAVMVAKEAARRQRHALIRHLSDVGVDVWGGPDWREALDGKNRYRGSAEHWTQLPRVYNAAKINLNMTRPYSDRGAPMRVFDVMSCGGFLLTNHPHTVKRWFTPGIDLETYDSKEELKEKSLYYLAHEQERERIAESGRMACMAAHTHKHRLSFILSKLFPKAPPAL